MRAWNCSCEVQERAYKREKGEDRESIKGRGSFKHTGADRRCLCVL